MLVKIYLKYVVLMVFFCFLPKPPYYQLMLIVCSSHRKDQFEN